MQEQALQRLEFHRIKEILLQYAVSYRGKQHVEQLLPMTGIKVIRQKLDETAEAKAMLRFGASVPIPSLEGIEPVMQLLGTGYVLNEKDFMHMHQFLTSCAQLAKYMASKQDAAPKVSSYAASLHELNSLKGAIDRSIRGGRVVDSASKELLKVRKRLAVYEDRLKGKLDSLMSKHRSILQEQLLSTRNGRYVLPIKKEHRKLVKGSVLDESASGQTVYIEPAEIMSLQVELSALRAEEAREELKVLSDLTAEAEGYAHELEINVETVGTYDFIFAKAKYALAVGGANVELNDQGIMDFSEARHPLMGERMVPLDFVIGRSFQSLIITGPNTGGKTLALKTVGLLTAMVQSGLLIPVREGSMMSIFSNIAVDIGDGQSIEHALSTFSAHIRNIIDILRIANRSTLVLIDEMASGTDPGEGVGLSVAILEELHRRGTTVVATTHFSEIKNFAEAAPGFENARMEFDAETLQPLYRLRIGEAGQSYAFLIALKLGIPEQIVHRSRAIADSGFTFDHLKPEEQEAERPLVPAVSVEVEQPSTSTSKASHSRSFQLGDSVYIPYMGRTGIVCELEDAKGIVGVLIQKQRFKINKKRLSLHIEGKDLYPENYDLDIVFESKDDRKKRKLMNRKYVKGLTIEKKAED
ncbi:endonuclease MutS2 [Paenibacillus sp. OAS669]|uniref:endonuclease MutS2 n=1 Tax=Paenibacillus sp. OAS669 TaxID=2663821 RepID=UPI00178A17B6|nr:DNA mismatch repair protein MutS [Paenibacillus sp. OAS669]MBE1442164.1 dsDNA-specific endonuclease/ATPase MutS2 [Paenibacillus sp. OAS669]